MVIDGSKIFGCQHEFVAFIGMFICHKCDHAREELPMKPRHSPRLYFFPISPPAVEGIIATNSYCTGTLA